jgi:hypothetical protein
VSPIFSINFRRAAYQRELARARRRIVALGAWLTYFGMVVIVVGLYGLNCYSLGSRVNRLERRTAQIQAAQQTNRDWSVDAAQMADVERFHASPQRWRDRLVRLAALLPANAVLVSAAVNPDNLSNAVDQNKLVVVGHIRGPVGSDRMQQVVQLVSRMHADTLFSIGYENIRLVSSRALDDGPVTEFTIECH